MAWPTTGMRPCPPRRGQRTGDRAWVCPAAAQSRTPASRAAEQGDVRPLVAGSLHLAQSSSLAFPFEDVTRAQQPDLGDGQSHCAASCRRAWASTFPNPQKAEVRRVGEVVQKTSTGPLRNSSSDRTCVPGVRGLLPPTSLPKAASVFRVRSRHRHCRMVAQLSHSRGFPQELRLSQAPTREGTSPLRLVGRAAPVRTCPWRPAAPLADASMSPGSAE